MTSGRRSVPLAAVCCHFNPAHFVSRLANYRRFREAFLGSGVRLLTVELAFGDDPFEVPDAPDVHRVRGGDVLWQKERLLQIGAERLVAEGAEAVAFLDADLVFPDPDWPAAVIAALEQAPAVQCFETVAVAYSDDAFEVPSGVRHWLETGELTGRVGYAWAFRSEVVERVGLYQRCVVGGGDSMTFLGATGLASRPGAWEDGSLGDHAFVQGYGPAMVAHYRRWADALTGITGGRVDYARTPVRTLPHGTERDRRYMDRHTILEGFDPERDVICEPGGPLRWTERGRSRAAAVEAYFRDRHEDVA